MLLVEEREENGWIRSTFNLTYRVTWDQLLQAVHGAYPYFANPQVLVDGTQISVAKQSDILTIPEDRAIILRGISTVLNAPLIITFRNQSQAGSGIRRQRQPRVPQHHLREVQQVDVSAHGLHGDHDAPARGQAQRVQHPHPRLNTHTPSANNDARGAVPCILKDNTSITAGFGQRSR